MCFRNSVVEYYGEQATSWKLDEAIQLFYVGNESGAIASASRSPAEEIANPGPEENFV